MTDRVSDLIRNRNSLAIQKRAAWRLRYRILADSIRKAKRQVQAKPCDLTVKVQLEGLQSLAQIMMMERNLITWDLRDTAYEWA